MNDKTAESMIGVVRLVLLAALMFVILPAMFRTGRGTEPDAYILVPEDSVSAQWHYQQLPMHECRWCGRKVNLNRHHVIPQAANPALRDVRENLVVLCRDCHFVLGHRCNWHTYNPDVLYIVTHFTTCESSAETRKGLNGLQPPAEDDSIMHVTNDVPDKLRGPLERILKWNGNQNR